MQTKTKEFPITPKKYNLEKTNLRCPHCNLFFKKENCEKHTTENGNRTYLICPVCKIKHPLRATPRYKKHWKKRIEYKRI